MDTKEKALNIRLSILKMLTKAGSGHTGGSMDLADIFAVLYFKHLNYNIDNQYDEDRDRVVLSIGHTAPVLYATLAEAGFFPKEELLTLRDFGSRLQGHPSKDFNLPGVETSAGSLGQGLSIALGMALAAKMDNKSIGYIVSWAMENCRRVAYGRLPWLRLTINWIIFVLWWIETDCR